MQGRLESGLDRELGFEIREGDIVLGNFEDLEMGSTVDQKAGKHKKRKVSWCKSGQEYSMYVCTELKGEDKVA